LTGVIQLRLPGRERSIPNAGRASAKRAVGEVRSWISVCSRSGIRQ